MSAREVRARWRWVNQPDDDSDDGPPDRWREREARKYGWPNSEPEPAARRRLGCLVAVVESVSLLAALGYAVAVAVKVVSR